MTGRKLPSGEGPTADEWRRLEVLLAGALQVDAGERSAWVRRACADDDVLRAELESLIEAHDREGPLDRPVGRMADRVSDRELGGAPAAGTVVSHYEVQERIGSGGMGVVHRARDLRLGRTVALKFLPRALSADPGAKRRFLTEASAAAALDHVNACTVHEIGETDDGRLFIAMAYVEGDSLGDVIAAGPLTVERALDIAVQIARALECAHEHGVIHRDVKPANAMVGRDGVVRLVDFGIAKLSGGTLSEAGAAPGTVAYMSPEQVRSGEVDARTDLWSLGVVLHEMLAGERPFRGDNDAATLYAIAYASAAGLREHRGDVPKALERLVAHALEKPAARRFQSAREMREALERIAGDLRAGRGPGATGLRRRRRTAAVATLVIATALTAAGVGVWRRVERADATASLARIERLVADARYVEAHRLLARAARWLPGDTTLVRLAPAVTDRITVLSEPDGARAWLRLLTDEGGLAPDSVLAGTTPLRAHEVPRADYQVVVEKEGYAPAVRLASSAFNRAEASMGVPTEVVLEVRLLERAEQPDGLVPVPGSDYALVGREAPSAASVALADYFIGEHEVTNEEFRAFLLAGGYAEPRYWRHPFRLDGRALAWGQAMQRLVDRTGLPGPRGWSNQEFPAGEERHPVTGVTWYEAAAYAEFVGRRLPTIFEWEKAARDGRHTHFDQVVLPWGIAHPTRGIALRANFGSSGTTPVDAHPAGVSPYGAHDMAGNVEEWIANASGDERFVTGGAWDDPMYVFSNYATLSGFHASASLGFRVALDAVEDAGDQGSFEIPPGERTPEYRPVDEVTFEGFLSYYAYDRGDLDAEVVARVTTEDWTRELITIAGPWNDRTPLYLYLPTRAPRPLQTLLFVPGVNTFIERTVPEETERIMGPHVKAGRAVVAVALKGTRSRPWDAGRTAPTPSSVQFRQELVLHATELRRALDYLGTRPSEIDTTRLAYVAVSMGAGSRLPFAAVDPRFRSVVLIGGGIDERMQPTLPEANSVNFAPRITVPKLLVNGRWDEEHPWERRALPLWRLLREPKRLELIDGGHIPPAEARVPAINAWLDETLGAVGR